MKNIIKKQKLFFISLIGIVVVSLAMMTTFAFQTLGVDVKEGSSNDVKIKAGVLDVTFATSRRIDLKNMPLLNDYKSSNYLEFTIDNTNSTEDVQYKILLKNLEYSKELISEDFRYTIVKVKDGEENVIANNNFSDLYTNEYSFITNYGNFIYIKQGEVEKLRIYLWLHETDNNQNYLENTYFKGIIELNSYFAKDINDKTITNFKIYGNTIMTYDNDSNEQSIDHPVIYKSLGTYISDENDINFGKYKIYLSAKSNNLFKTDEKFLKENDNWIYQNVYLEKGTYKISYTSSDFKYIMIKDNNGNTIINKQSYTETFNIENDDYYNVYIGDDNYVFNEIETPAYYYASLVNMDSNYDFSKYEPYLEPVNYTLYLDNPLTCVNDICDYIDLVNNKIIIKNSKINLSKDSNWTLNTKNGYDIYISELDIATTNNLNATHLKYSKDYEIGNFKINNGKMSIVYSDINKSNIETFKKWVDKVTIYYTMDNEIVLPIDSINLTKFINRTISIYDDDNIKGKVEIEYNKK